MAERQRVAVVTGGGGGIGAAIAEALGRTGTHVVTLDPLVTLDGSEQLAAPEETTADRINAAGGSAEATSLSVTDADGVRDLFGSLARDRGGLDAVVNVAGITRPTSFARGTDDDWRSVLEVHLDGYLNVLRAALPLMAAAGHGRILGVTSGSGWRPADAGAYSCAKRAVASLTWQLGRNAPPGVVVNAISPIAATRMVAAALGRSRPAGAKSDAKASATGGLSLASMPTADQLGPLGAHLTSGSFSWCTGRVIFTAGSEVAVIDEPRLLEVVRLAGAASPARVLEAVTPALVAAETSQATSGGSNARFAGIFDESEAVATDHSPVRTCLVVADDATVAQQLSGVLNACGIAVELVEPPVPLTANAAAQAMDAAADRLGALDAVVVVRSESDELEPSSTSWGGVLAGHAGIVERLHGDAGWARALAGRAAAVDAPMRLVTLTEATTAGGRSRAQVACQLARAAQGATEGRVAWFAVSVEAPWVTAAEASAAVVAHLLGGQDTAALSGAELVLADGWFGLRSHPHPSASITYGGPEIPQWFDGALRRLVGVPMGEIR